MNGKTEEAAVDALEQARGAPAVTCRRRKKMTSGPKGKIVFYTFAQLKMIIILGVVCWRQKIQIHDVLETI